MTMKDDVERVSDTPRASIAADVGLYIPIFFWVRRGSPDASNIVWEEANAQTAHIGIASESTIC